MTLHIVILAAGQGKRMASIKPKVLHTVGGKPMLAHVVDAACALAPEKIHVIYGHGGNEVPEALAYLPVNWIHQDQQLGTGHALMQALPHIPEESTVLVLSGDVPLIQVDTLCALLEKSMTEVKAKLTLLLAIVPDPTGLGRIVRDISGCIQAIIEEKDATEAERKLQETYSGICCVAAADLRRFLPELSHKNAQKEYYLTDIVAQAVAEKQDIQWHTLTDITEMMGVNTRVQLERVERWFQRRQAVRLMEAGVSLVDAARIDIRGTVTAEQDVFIDVNTVFEGEVFLATGCSIGPNCLLKNVTLAANCVIHANSVLEDSIIGEGSHIGPFARLRPGTQLGAHCKVGNFVETKKAVFGAYSKANHLSYLGDVTLGSQVNIGAGTITCNYDGVSKSQTIIADGVFVGSGTQLVAPITIGKNATIGAGTTVRKDVAATELAITEARQKNIAGWVRKDRSVK